MSSLASASVGTGPSTFGINERRSGKRLPLRGGEWLVDDGGKS